MIDDDGIGDLIKHVNMRYVLYLTLHQRERRFFEEKIYVGLESTPHFNLRAKIVGPQGSFVKHIQSETGTRVQLKGKGSGFYETSTGLEAEEPLHVHIT